MKLDDELSSLDKVEEISKIIAEMSSTDISTSSNAILEAEKMLKCLEEKKEVNRTMINKISANSVIPPSNGQPERMEVDAFKMMVEKDAAERRERREKERKKASRLKNQANEFFMAGDCDKAVTLYTRAIETSKDWSILYTNRAQAYLRLGMPDKALADCDVALQLFPLEPVTTATNLGDEANNARDINKQIAKVYLHRGKSLVSLRRPMDALNSYTNSRTFSSYSTNPAIKNPGPENDEWPPYLRDYVAQARAAIAAEKMDSKAKDLLSLRFSEDEPEISMAFLLQPNEQTFLRLIAELAADEHDVKQYTLSLLKMTRLLNSATEETKKAINIDKVPEKNDEKSAIINLDRIPDIEVTNEKTTRQRRRKNAKKLSHNGEHFDDNDDQKGISETDHDKENYSDADLPIERLQSFFRIKNGFKALRKQMELFKSSDTLKELYKDNSELTAEKKNTTLLNLFHLRGLLTVCSQLCNNCGENQRLLIDNMPQLFSNVVMDCLELSPTESKLSTIDNVLSSDFGDSKTEISHRYVMEDLRFSACDLLNLLSSNASGRESLLVYPGPARLLSSLSFCLSDVLGLPKPNATANSQKTSTETKQKPSSPNSTHFSSLSLQTVAAISRILESLTQSPHFMSLVSSSDCYSGLQDVVEAAVTVPPSSNSATNVASAMCMSLLMDSLSTACHDVAVRRRLICKQNFIKNLAGCFLVHAPLMSDENHVALVGSVCRLLHNCVTGEGSPSLDVGVLDNLLEGIGIVLDQPSRGTAILSVIIVLLGKIFPMCSSSQVEQWCSTGAMIEVDHSKKSHTPRPNQNVTKRVNLLLSIIKSYSVSVLHETVKPKIDIEGRAFESKETLEAHRLRGAIRSLAVITKAPGCQCVRFAIGDDRLTTRRLACLVRARAAHSSDAPPSVAASPPPRDEPLAANVCLILQNCIDDTPLAENLEGTAILMDLFKLIEEAKKMETKRNAAIFAGKLASASHVHRDVFSGLKGYSILSPFHKWTRALDGDNIR